MKVNLYEVNYGVSPGGEDCWEADVFIALGHTNNYSDGKTAGEVLDYIIREHPGIPLEVDVMSLEAYNSKLEDLPMVYLGEVL